MFVLAKLPDTALVMKWLRLPVRFIWYSEVKLPSLKCAASESPFLLVDESENTYPSKKSRSFASERRNFPVASAAGAHISYCTKISLSAGTSCGTSQTYW